MDGGNQCSTVMMGILLGQSVNVNWESFYFLLYLQLLDNCIINVYCGNGISVTALYL